MRQRRIGRHSRGSSRKGGATAAVAALALVACGGGDDGSTASALDATGRAQALDASASCGNRINNTFDKLLECVTLEGVRAHQAALQAIADANGGTRAAGTPGYDQSVHYVVGKLTAAGYQVTLNPFPFVFVRPADAAADRADHRRPTRPARSPAPATAASRRR